MSLTRVQGILLGSVFMLGASSVPADDGGIGEAMRGVASAMADVNDALNIAVLNLSDSPEIEGDRITASTGTVFDFAKNTICPPSGVCSSMNSLNARNKESLTQAACSQAARAGNAGTAFSTKHCAGYKPR